MIEHTQDELDLCSRIDPEIDSTLHVLHDSFHSPTGVGFVIKQYRVEYHDEPMIFIQMKNFLFDLKTNEFKKLASAIREADDMLRRIETGQ